MAKNDHARRHNRYVCALDARLGDRHPPPLERPPHAHAHGSPRHAPRIRIIESAVAGPARNHERDMRTSIPFGASCVCADCVLYDEDHPGRRCGLLEGVRCVGLSPVDDCCRAILGARVSR